MSDERFEVVAPVPLNLVCFRYRGSDDENQRLMDRLNQSGDLYLTHTRWETGSFSASALDKPTRSRTMWSKPGSAFSRKLEATGRS